MWLWVPEYVSMGYQQLLGGAKFCNSDDFWILGERLVQVLLQAEATKWLALTPVETTEGSCHSRLVLLRAAQEELHPSSLDRRRFQREAP